MDEVTVQYPVFEHYSIRTDHGDWGEIALKFTGPESVVVMAFSSFGAYGHYWSHCGMHPHKALAGMDRGYAMEKLSGYSLYEPDTSKWADEIKRRIIEARREGRIDRYNARTCLEEMVDCVDELSDPTLILDRLYCHDHFSEIFGDHDGLPQARRIKPAHAGFWNDIWLPFIEQLKQQQKEAA